MKLVDLIQHRYGWTDEVVFNLPYARFLDICEVVVEQTHEDRTQQFRYAAFTSFLVSGLKDTSFDQYIESLGLSPKSNAPKKVVKAEDALAKANEILAKFNKT